MISWIQITFEKHTKVVFAFLLFVITVPFVFTIGAAPGIGKGDRRAQRHEFFGYNLSSQGDSRRISLDAQLSLMIRPEVRMTANIRSLQEYAFQRTASLALADRYHLPHPTAAQREKFITSLFIFQNEQGQFDPSRYSRFRDQLRTSQDYTEADVARVVDDECRIQQIGALLGGPGYVAPLEIANQLTLASTQWTLRVAEFDLATYAPAIHPTEEALAKYFEDNAAKFEIPDRVNLDYVTFKTADFPSVEQLSDDEVVAYFEANKDRYATPAAEAGKPATPAVLATARPKVEADMRAGAAGLRAAKAASDFAYEIYLQSTAKKITKGSPEIDALVAKFHGHRATAPLFTRQGPPAGLAWPRQAIDTAFRLDDERFFSDPFAVGDDQVVMLWHETLPKFKPELSIVRDQVLADFTESEKSRILTQNAPAWKATLEAKLAAGVKLEDAVAALLGAPKAEVKNYGPFTRRQPPEGVARPVFGALDRLTAGSLSDLLRDDRKAYFVQVVERKAPTIDRNSAEFAQIGTAAAASLANVTRTELLTQLVEAELQRSAPPAE